MHIGMFSNAYKPIISGVVRSISLYRQGLQRAGHFVPLFTPEGKGYEDDEPFIFRYPALPLPTGLDYTFPVVVAPQITWLVPRLKLDIVHSHHPFVVGSEAVAFSRTEGIPLVFTFHTLYHEYTHYLGVDAEVLRHIVRRLIGEYVRKAHRVIAPSSRVRDLLPSYNVDRPVDILPTPVDLDLFPPRTRPIFSDPDRIQLLYVGRVAKEKNLTFLLNAFARAARQDKRLHLRIIGDGNDISKLRTYARKLNLANRVVFTGAVPFEQVAAELRTADLFIFSSTTETQGLVILEAMAAYLPIILVSCPALLDFVRPGIDTIVVPEQEQDFADAILMLAQDPERARAMGRAARSNAEAYSVPTLSNRLLDIYQHTIEDYRQGRYQ